MSVSDKALREAAKHIPCPRCGTRVGDCRRPSRTKYEGGYIHVERLRAARYVAAIVVQDLEEAA